MYKHSIDVADLLNKEVISKDVLNVYKNINNCNLANMEVIDLENILLINSFRNNGFLFQKEYFYYKLSLALKNIGMFDNNKGSILNKFSYLLNVTEEIFENQEDINQKIEAYNKIIIDLIYMENVNKPVTPVDVLQIYRGINYNNSVSKEIIQLENKLLVNSFCKNKFLFTNKLVYYKISSVLKGIGFNTKNEEIVNSTFNVLSNVAQLIFSNDYIDNYEKINIFDFLCFKYELLDNNSKKDTDVQQYIVSLNNETNLLIQKIASMEPIKHKSLNYSLPLKQCIS